jgi:3-dehydroquinate dehydratase-2
MSKPIYLLNGPNMNLLGEWEPETYGRRTLAQIEAQCRQLAEQRGVELIARQTNAEHELIAWLHEARHAAGIVINPAAFCYHSIPVLDAMKMCQCPIIEVHITNLYRRVATRNKSVLASASTGMITGLGSEGYRLALEHLLRLMDGAALAT